MTTRSAVALAAVLAVGLSVPACSPPRADPPLPSTDTGEGTTESAQQTSGSEPECGPPALTVTSPQDGARVTTPFQLAYETTCFSVDGGGTIYFTADGIHLDLHPKTPTGTVTVPDHPLLSGRRTVRIQLADPNGQALDNPEARITMTIIVEGSRDGG